MKCQRLLQPFADAATTAATATTANSIDFPNDVIKRIWLTLRIRNIFSSIVILIKSILMIGRKKKTKISQLVAFALLYFASLFNCELF